MRDPEMQKMLYPYLPEPMRNPSSIEWMLNNPEVKKQMSDMFESQVCAGVDSFRHWMEVLQGFKLVFCHVCHTSRKGVPSCLHHVQ